MDKIEKYGQAEKMNKNLKNGRKMDVIEKNEGMTKLKKNKIMDKIEKYGQN